jgi:hypothetical protein
MTHHPAADWALAFFALVCIVLLLLWTAFGPPPKSPA